MKHILALFAIILMLVSEVYAKDDKWIDGIRFRYAIIYNPIDFMLESGEEPLMRVESGYRHLNNQQSLPIAIVLPETLMNSWSFRGGVFEWQQSTGVTDLVPSNGARQTSSQRTILYNDFFNASDKAFADANPNWALTADITSSRSFLGYVWGVFIPAFENHRFLKAGIGPGIFAADISYKLNLCSEYKITTSQDQSSGNSKEVECIDKKEIDTASWNGYGLGLFFNVTVWERFTKDSIWRILTTIGGASDASANPEPKLKNHNKNLKILIGSQIIEFISYTYRF